MTTAVEAVMVPVELIPPIAVRVPAELTLPLKIPLLRTVNDPDAVICVVDNNDVIATESAVMALVVLTDAARTRLVTEISCAVRAPDELMEPAAANPVMATEDAVTGPWLDTLPAATLPVTAATLAVSRPALLIEPETVRSLPVLIAPRMSALPPILAPEDVERDCPVRPPAACT